MFWKGGVLDACFRMRTVVGRELSDENFNSANVEGFTPLHYAAGEGNLQVIKYLVEACQCDPEFPDNLGLTPEFCRCERVMTAHFQISEILESLDGKQPSPWI